jgi:Uma2 family endonuclease
MSAAPLLPPDAIPGTRRKYFTRQEVERMLASGALDGQRLELIDGELFDKMGQNPPHATAIQNLTDILAGIFPGRRIRVQLPMEASEPDRDRSLPEPDVAVLRLRSPEHAHRHPSGDELILVVEVADTTAAFDLSRKAELYANAGVPEYWVVDLNRRKIVTHREPAGGKYGVVRSFGTGELVSVDTHTIAVDEILSQAV